MSQIQRGAAERPLVGVQISSVTPLPVEGECSVPRPRGAVFFCPPNFLAPSGEVGRKGEPTWPS